MVIGNSNYCVDLQEQNGLRCFLWVFFGEVASVKQIALANFTVYPIDREKIMSIPIKNNLRIISVCIPLWSINCSQKRVPILQTEQIEKPQIFSINADGNRYVLMYGKRILHCKNCFGQLETVPKLFFGDSWWIKYGAPLPWFWSVQGDGVAA